MDYSFSNYLTTHSSTADSSSTGTNPLQSIWRSESRVMSIFFYQKLEIRKKILKVNPKLFREIGMPLNNPLML
jgi:hypothetical protein